MRCKLCDNPKLCHCAEIQAAFFFFLSFSLSLFFVSSVMSSSFFVWESVHLRSKFMYFCICVSVTNPSEPVPEIIFVFLMQTFHLF